MQKLCTELGTTKLNGNTNNGMPFCNTKKKHRADKRRYKRKSNGFMENERKKTTLGTTHKNFLFFHSFNNVFHQTSIFILHCFFSSATYQYWKCLLHIKMSDTSISSYFFCCVYHFAIKCFAFCVYITILIKEFLLEVKRRWKKKQQQKMNRKKKWTNITSTSRDKT